LQLQAMNSALRIPVTLVQTHMPELAALAPGTSAAIAVQLVLLPGAADDATADTPPYRVLELRQGRSLRYIGTANVQQQQPPPRLLLLNPSSSKIPGGQQRTKLDMQPWLNYCYRLVFLSCR
jgi:hypothetical protein